MNFGILKGCQIVTVVSGQRNENDVLERAGICGDYYELIFENGYTLKINRNVMLYHYDIQCDDVNEGCIFFSL